MLEKLKTWYANNQKMAMYVAAGAVAVYFGYKWFKKNAGTKRLSRRA